MKTISRNVLAAAAVVAAAAVAAAAPTAAQVAQERTSKAPATRTYVTKAAVGDMFEIEASRLALERAEAPAVRDFARLMLDDHGRMSQKLTAAARESGLTPPSELDAAHADKVKQLRTASGKAFDEMYVRMQRSAHEAALQLHRDYSRQGEAAALKAVATEAVPIIQGHLDRLKAMPGQSS